MELYPHPLWDDVTPRREDVPLDAMRIQLTLLADALKGQLTARLQAWSVPEETPLLDETSKCTLTEPNLTQLGNQIHGTIHLVLDDLDPF